jgi:hypothetical protein
LDWKVRGKGKGGGDGEEADAEEMRDMAEESVGRVRTGDVVREGEGFEKGKGKRCLFKSDLERDLI